MGGQEIKKVSYLTGAEEERAKLNALLDKRRSFTGSVGTDDDDDLTSTDGGENGEAGNGKGKSKGKGIIGFGKAFSAAYGYGDAFDESADAAAENARFHTELDRSELSKVVQMRGGKGWTKTEDLEHDPKKLEEKAKKAKRSKLVYSGISA